MTSQFKYDYWRVMASLAMQPTNWVFHYPYRLSNEKEKMHVWVANGYFAVSFMIEMREYGYVHPGSVFFGWAIPWRRKLLKRARQTGRSVWVVKYGSAWEAFQHMHAGKDKLGELNEAFRAGQNFRIATASNQYYEFGAGVHLLYVWFKNYFRLQRFPWNCFKRWPSN